MIIFNLLTLMTMASTVQAKPEQVATLMKRHAQNPPPCPPLTCPQKVTRSQIRSQPKWTLQDNQPQTSAAFRPKVKSNTIAKREEGEIAKREEGEPPCPPLTCPQQLKRKLKVVVARQASNRRDDKRGDAAPPCPPLTCPQQLKRKLQSHSADSQSELSKSSVSMPFWHRESSGQKVKKAQHDPPCPPLTCPLQVKRLIQSKLELLELSSLEALASVIAKRKRAE